MEILEAIGPAFPETAKVNFGDLARGGLSTDYLFLSCFADYSVAEYLVGSGGSSGTVAYDPVAEARLYELFRLAQAAGESLGVSLLPSEGGFEASHNEVLIQAEESLTDRIGDRESVVFLAPMGAHNAIAVESWQVVEQWDLQTDEDDVVHAVRYGVPASDPESAQTLANLKSRITAAAAADEFADDRIENVSGLTQYYRDIGSYGDITPGDGESATFTPAQPSAVSTCAGGTAVTDPGTNRGLVYDCEVLLGAKDTLRGPASLDWSASTAITGWEGVTTGGTP